MIVCDVARYRVQYGAAVEASSSTAVQEHYTVWVEKMQLVSQEALIATTLRELHQVLSTVQSEKQQVRIDALALVLGFLGLIGVCNDMTAAYYSTEGDDQTSQLTAQTATAGAVLLLAILTSYFQITIF